MTITETIAQVSAERGIDAAIRYCAKTGQPIGAHDLARLDHAARLAPIVNIRLSLETGSTTCAAHWIDTSPERLDVLLEKDSAAYIVYCLAALTRRFFCPYPNAKSEEKRLANREAASDFYWCKARAYALLTGLDQHALDAITPTLALACRFETNTLKVLALKLGRFGRAPDDLARAAVNGTLEPVLQQCIGDAIATILAYRNPETYAIPELELIQKGATNIRGQKSRKLRRSKKQLVVDKMLAAFSLLDENESAKQSTAKLLARFANVTVDLNADDLDELPVYSRGELDRLPPSIASLFDTLGDLSDSGDDTDTTVTMRRVSASEYRDLIAPQAESAQPVTPAAPKPELPVLGSFLTRMAAIQPSAAPSPLSDHVEPEPEKRPEPAPVTPKPVFSHNSRLFR